MTLRLRDSVLLAGGHHDVGVIKTQHGHVADQRYVEHDKELQHGERIYVINAKCSEFCDLLLY